MLLVGLRQIGIIELFIVAIIVVFCVDYMSIDAHIRCKTHRSVRVYKQKLLFSGKFTKLAEVRRATFITW